MIKKNVPPKNAHYKGAGESSTEATSNRSPVAEWLSEMARAECEFRRSQECKNEGSRKTGNELSVGLIFDRRCPTSNDLIAEFAREALMVDETDRSTFIEWVRSKQLVEYDDDEVLVEYAEFVREFRQLIRTQYWAFTFGPRDRTWRAARVASKALWNDLQHRPDEIGLKQRRILQLLDGVRDWERLWKLEAPTDHPYRCFRFQMGDSFIELPPAPLATRMANLSTELVRIDGGFLDAGQKIWEIVAALLCNETLTVELAAAKLTIPLDIFGYKGKTERAVAQFFRAAR